MKTEPPVQENHAPPDSELSRNLFRLKTLYDVSRVLLEQGDVDKILRNFLLMTMGSFGAANGFVFVQEDPSLLPQKLTMVGLEADMDPVIEAACHRLLLDYDRVPVMEHVDQPLRLAYFPPYFSYLSVFNIADACNGVLALGPKLTDEPYSDDDTELFETLVINLTGALKNVRSTEALKSAFREVSSLNEAKTKVIDHLSHELKTPISLLVTSLALMRKYLAKLPEDRWTRTCERADRSLKRLSEIQRVAQDIMKEKVFEQHRTASMLLSECADILKGFAAEQLEEGAVVERIQQRIDEVYRPVDQIESSIVLADFVKDSLAYCMSQSRHRSIDIELRLNSTKSVTMPKEILSIIVVGVMKNAIENTPDQGRIKVVVKDVPTGVNFWVQDFGTGIVAGEREHIFSGFYPTQATDRYCTKRPYDFNAGGKGTELLRIKIFSESYAFKIQLATERCSHIPTPQDICPGSIVLCDHCRSPEDCHASGTTTVTVAFTNVEPGVAA